MDYLEVYILSKNGDVNIDADIFEKTKNKMISKCRNNKKHIVFNKQVVKTFSDDLILESVYDDYAVSSSPSRETVYNLYPQSLSDTPLYKNIVTDECKVDVYKKHVKPNHCFPSTANIYDMMYEDKTIVKLTNILYMNFSKTIYRSEKEKQYYYIYMNYNNNEKCDMKMNIDSINQMVQSVLSLI